jgi:hypothetical protein
VHIEQSIDQRESPQGQLLARTPNTSVLNARSHTDFWTSQSTTYPWAFHARSVGDNKGRHTSHHTQAEQSQCLPQNLHLFKWTLQKKGAPVAGILYLVPNKGFTFTRGAGRKVGDDDWALVFIPSLHRPATIIQYHCLIHTVRP